ncbi:MAG: hypothetical protein ACRD19_14990 [Terriglobia bacterium]
MKSFRTLSLSLALLCLGSVAALAQNRTEFSGIRNAFDYAYGVNTSVAPLRVDSGNSATGSQTITLAFGNIYLGDGTVVMPLSTTAPVTVGVGANAETVTPSAVSCATPNVYDTCTITATFSNTHGVGDLVSSGTFGLEEAVNAAHTLGGLIAIDGRWTQLGGATSTVTGNKGWTNVTILDWRGTSGAVSYKAASNGADYAATSTALY